LDVGRSADGCVDRPLRLGRKIVSDTADDLFQLAVAYADEAKVAPTVEMWAVLTRASLRFAMWAGTVGLEGDAPFGNYPRPPRVARPRQCVTDLRDSESRPIRGLRSGRAHLPA
jgi:hypothetical protein